MRRKEGDEVSKKFYWIKLKSDFFDLETIDWLLSQKKGCEYVILYLKLCLLTVNQGGNMFSTLNEMIIPFNTEKISRDTKMDYDTVVVGLELFKRVGLIYENNETGLTQIPYVNEIVGCETEYAQKKREYREKLKQNSQNLLTENEQSKAVLLKNNEQNINCQNLLTENEQFKTILLNNDEQNIKSRQCLGQCLGQSPKNPSNSDNVRQEIEIEKDIDIYIINNNQSTSVDRLSEKGTYESQFNELWSLYPKKEGKKEAFAAYKRVIKKGVTNEQIREGIARYVQYLNSNKVEMRYVKKGSTFFHQECWNDEYNSKFNNNNGNNGAGKKEQSYDVFDLNSLIKY